MGIKKINPFWMCAVAWGSLCLMGCDVIPVGKEIDKSVAASHIATGLAYHGNMNDETSPTPKPNPSGCENCCDTGWLGDGRPRDSCPLCNDPVTKRKPSVSDYLRQLEEWRRRNGESQKTASTAHFWSPSEEDWNSLNFEVKEAKRDIAELKSEKKTGLVPTTKEAFKEIAEPKKPAENRITVTMHSNGSCVYCNQWFENDAKKLAPTRSGNEWRGRLNGIPITVKRDDNHQDKTVPWWTIKYKGESHNLTNNNIITPQLVLGYVPAEDYLK